MKISIITSALLLTTAVISAQDSIYDGTGSLINANQGCWGCDRDEARMHPHRDKGSTVSFQVLRNPLNCDHIDIHSDIDLGQDVRINLKSWAKTTIGESYIVRLPNGAWNTKDGISLDMTNNYWTTLSITTTQPLNKQVSIYAYCRNSTDIINDNGLESISPDMTRLDNNHFYLGNGSLITISDDNGETGYGTRKDTAMSSTNYNAETSFQVLGNRDNCSEITLTGSSSEIEEVLIKGWNEDRWKQTDCVALPCTVDAYLRDDNKDEYTLINIRTKANANNKYLNASCSKEDVDINLKEKIYIPKHPHNCKFNDVAKGSGYYPYITALCSAGIVEGYGGSVNYTQFGPDNPTLWSELAKVVNLSDNYYKTKKIRDTYSSEPWYDAYLDIAKKQGFDYDSGLEINRGLAYRYIVKVFWNKDLSESESATFLRDKGISYRSNTTLNLKRGYMAEIILKSAKISADEIGVDKKIPYVNHDTKDLDIKQDETLPMPSFETPKSGDSMDKKIETIQKNIKNSLRGNNTVSEKGQTNNTGATISNLGGKDTLKSSYGDKNSAEDIIEETKREGINIPVSPSSKIKKNSIVEIVNKSTGETILAPTLKSKDSKGNSTILLETEHGKNKEVTKKELEDNNLEVKSQAPVEKMLKKGE